MGNNLIAEYRKLEAEYEILSEICGHFLQVRYTLEKIKQQPNHGELLANDIIAESTSYLQRLESQFDGNEEKREALAILCLKQDHEISIGEKIGYKRLGMYEPSYIKVEHVEIQFKPEYDEDTYVVSGFKFKKDGKVGQQINRHYLPVRIT